MKYYCIDCKKEIYINTYLYGTKRCKSCAAKNNIKIYGHPMLGKYHTEKTKLKISKTKFKIGTQHCIDCNKDLKHYHKEVKRCNSCAKKYQYKIKPETKPNLGKKEALSSGWKGGKPKCKICEKSLTNYNAIYCKKHYGVLLKLDKNPMWHGGISFEPYTIAWTKILKNTIRERDNYNCVICNKYGKDVHHIDYNKENCEKDNLITLCHKCHIKTNFNRDYWYAYFTYIMEII